ncbi:hypothetical protein C0991_007590 [Blastosporella zonata]|nr:hypothetical protein C0991_007590 [Blastosporella zonata]
MSRRFALDTTVPQFTGLASPAVFDRNAFTKSFDILAVRAPASKVASILRAREMQGSILDLQKVRSVDVDPTDPKNCRLILLKIIDKAELPEQALNFLEQSDYKGLVPYTFTLGYDHWTADEIINTVMPDHLKEKAPSGFAITGHIAHLNLTPDYVPYRRLIGQIILDKNKTIRTVVNKLDSIDSVFRFFKMDLIAGEPDFIVEHHETDCSFTFDFREVYWNSRLHTEHGRLVEMFSPDDVVADVFAGVGPFAVPAAKKGCAVFANDLNPNSAKYLKINVDRNGASRQLYPKTTYSDPIARAFIRSAFRRSFDGPFPALVGPRLSKSQLRKIKKAGQYQSPSESEEPLPPRRRISHFVMNLPDTAITFLDVFRGALASDNVLGLRETYAVMPMIHCYCFTRELEPEKAEVDIRQRVEEKLGAPLTTDSAATTMAPVNPTDPEQGSLTATAMRTVRTALDVPERELSRWRRIFDANAKVVDGEKYLDPESFVNAIAPSGDLTKIGRAQFAILFRVADASRRGLVSWDDFTVFETLLKRPDADYWMAFQYFDVDHDGYITFDEFKNVFTANVGPDAIPFDFDCDWVKLYLGKKNGTHVLGYNEFTQLMKGLQGERLRQAFKYLDADQDGFIRPDQFKSIILEIAGHKLSQAVIERLPTLCTLSPGQRISYSEVVAFHNVIRQMDMVERIIREATAKSKDGRIDQSDFLNHASSSSRYSLFTPMEASIIFHFASRGAANQRLALIDFAQLLDPRWRAPHDEVEYQAPKATKSFFSNVLHSTYNFGLGGIAGAFGATIVYPIDMGTIMPILLVVLDDPSTIPLDSGVAPEKAIKLTVNDLIRTRATDPETGRIKIGWELVAGGMAGGCQVVFTNPLEIVKIRLQVQGEAAKVEGAVPKGAIHIIRQLGVLGLYKGASACLLRDIPFSAIYFPAYWHLKKDLFNEGYNGKQLSFLETLGAAGIAGMPAAYLTTPADVVKTRLQVEARQGQTHYKGLRDTFVKIYKEEGFKALFKGYESLKTYLPYPWDEKPHKVETALTSRPDDLSKIRARNALKILLDVHGDFGRRAAASGVPLSLTSPRLSEVRRDK